MDLSPFADAALGLPQARYLLFALKVASLVVDGKGFNVHGLRAVYDGYQAQFGPLYLEVLSPHRSFFNYLREKDHLKCIIATGKGRAIEQYIEEAARRAPENEPQEPLTRREALEHFYPVPQNRNHDEILRGIEDIQERFEMYDPYYESTKSLFNDTSIVVKITYSRHDSKQSFLFPGDLIDWTLLLADHEDAVRECIVKAPQHGGTMVCDPEQYIRYKYGFVLNELERVDPFLWHEQILRWRNCAQSLWLDKFPLRDACHGPSVYAWLRPQSVIIYPFRYGARRLPRLDVRNDILNAAGNVLCSFREGDCKGCQFRPEESVKSVSTAQGIRYPPS